MAGTAPTENGRHRRFTDQLDSGSSRIGRDVTLTGDLHGTGDLVVEGKVNGNLELEGLVWVRPGGRIEGDLRAVDAVIEGDVVGNVHVSHKLELRASCRVLGDLDAQGLAIAEGGHFEGSITMAGRSPARSAVSFTEKRSPEP